MSESPTLAAPDPTGSVRTLCEGDPGICRECRQGFLINPRFPEEHKFCSARCRARWNREHAHVTNLTPEPAKRLTSLKVAILNLMQDGRPWSKLELAVVVGSEPHSVGSRLSELDRMGRRNGLWRIVPDLRNGNSKRAHRYRMVRG